MLRLQACQLDSEQSRTSLGIYLCGPAQSPEIVESTTPRCFFFVSGFVSGAYSAKLLAGTRQRFSRFGQPRQCWDDVLRMLVTGGPPVRGGGGIPHRIMLIS